MSRKVPTGSSPNLLALLPDDFISSDWLLNGHTERWKESIFDVLKLKREGLTTCTFDWQNNWQSNRNQIILVENCHKFDDFCNHLLRVQIVRFWVVWALSDLRTPWRSCRGNMNVRSLLSSIAVTKSLNHMQDANKWSWLKWNVPYFSYSLQFQSFCGTSMRLCRYRLSTPTKELNVETCSEFSVSLGFGALGNGIWQNQGRKSLLVIWDNYGVGKYGMNESLKSQTGNVGHSFPQEISQMWEILLFSVHGCRGWTCRTLQAKQRNWFAHMNVTLSLLWQEQMKPTTNLLKTNFMTSIWKLIKALRINYQDVSRN